MVPEVLGEPDKGKGKKIAAPNCNTHNENEKERQTIQCPNVKSSKLIEETERLEIADSFKK